MAPDEPDGLHIPLVEEQVVVGKREVETDHVRVRTVVDTHDVMIEQMLRTERVNVNRVAVDREVAVAPAPYQDGDTLVISIIEERLVIEKRLFVVEEVRVTNSVEDQTVNIPASLRRMRAVVERDDTNQTAAGRSNTPRPRSASPAMPTRVARVLPMPRSARRELKP